MDNASDGDDFWSVAMLPPSTTDRPAAVINGTVTDGRENSQEDDETSAIQSFTLLPSNPSEKPLILNLLLKCNDGILSDVSGIPWDAALLLAGFLYGTSEGRRLCYDACFGNFDGVGGSGILELGSGLGIVGLAAAAAALSVRAAMQEERSNGSSESVQDVEPPAKQSAEEEVDTASHRVVLSDRNEPEILSHLRKNVDANRDAIAEAPNQRGDLHITVEECDWMDVSNAVRLDPARQLTHAQCPTGPFNLIIGSALVYLPEHAAACADTLFYYLTYGGASNASNSTEDAPQRQAIVVQFLDRDGFATHFLPRCRELGLEVSGRELSRELIERVQMGWNRRIPSVEDYRMFVIKAGRG